MKKKESEIDKLKEKALCGMFITLRELCEESHKTALEKGWHDSERSIGDYISLFHSELSEALEEARNGHPLDYIYLESGPNTFDPKKPCGFIIEIADLLIRLGDFLKKNHLDKDIDMALRMKMSYNKTRPYRHGNKKL